MSFERADCLLKRRDLTVFLLDERRFVLEVLLDVSLAVWAGAFGGSRRTEAAPRKGYEQ